MLRDIQPYLMVLNMAQANEDHERIFLLMNGFVDALTNYERNLSLVILNIQYPKNSSTKCYIPYLQY